MGCTPRLVVCGEGVGQKAKSPRLLSEPILLVLDGVVEKKGGCIYRVQAGQTVLGEGMATPNYSFEKRKREQAQKAAKEAKRLRKAEKAAAGPVTAVEEPVAPSTSEPLTSAE